MIKQVRENTIELRWFKRGIPPAEVEEWFDRHCLQNQVGEEVRTDFYLYLPESTTVSYKWRQENLELKWRQAELEAQKFGEVWSGKIERWSKWIDRQGIPQQQLNNFLPAKFWLEVSKQRQQRQEAGITGELTKLKINSHLWWSIAFEMADDNCQHFVSILERLSTTYCGSQLSVSDCFAYPRLLAEIILKT